MDSASIVQLVGQPDEITPLKVDSGKAETWVYRRKIGQTIHQTANTQTFIRAMVGFQASGPVIGKTVVPEYRLKYIRAYQVTALLMVDGKLQLGRQWSRRTNNSPTEQRPFFRVSRDESAFIFPERPATGPISPRRGAA